MAKITISQRQTPCFRALIATEDGTLFDPETDLASQADLTAEGIEATPISYTLYKTESALYYQSGSGQAEPVEGFQDVEIDAGAFIDPDDVERDSGGNLTADSYNFSFVPDARSVFPFADVGTYFADFTVYPKTGAAIVWRTWVYVQ